MKLVDLEATGRFDHPLVIRFSQGTFEQLAPYRATREASGFVRLAVRVLLAVGDDDDGKLGTVADELVTSCATMENLYTLMYNVNALWREMGYRANQIQADSPQDSLS